MVTEGINKSIPFLFLPILSHYLLPDEYGIISNYGVLNSIFLILIAIGVNSAIAVNFYKLNFRQLSEYLSNSLLIITVSTLLMILLTIFFKSIIFKYTKIPLTYQLLAVITAYCNVLITIKLSLFRLEHKPIKFGGFNIIKTLLGVSLTVLLVIIINSGWKGRLNALIITALIFGLYCITSITIQYKLSFKIKKSVIKKIILFGLPLIPHALSFWLRSGVDRLLITRLVSETATGLFSVAFLFGTLITFISSSFNNAFSPYIFKSLNVKDKNELNSNKLKIVKIVYVNILIYLLLSIFIVVLSKFILLNFFDDKYFGAQEFIVWIIFSATLDSIYLLFVNYIIFKNKTKQLSIITFISASLHVFFSYILILNFGAIGAAYSSVLISFLVLISVVIYSNKIIYLPWLYIFKIKK